MQITLVGPLLYRKQGAETKQQILDALAQTDGVTLNFFYVERVTPAWVEEALGSLDPDVRRRVCITGLTDYTRDAVRHWGRGGE